MLKANENMIKSLNERRNSESAIGSNKKGCKDKIFCRLYGEGICNGDTEYCMLRKESFTSER